MFKSPFQLERFLLNEKRQQLESIQRRHKVRVLVIPNPNMETPNYDLQRLRDDDPQVASLELSIDIQTATPDPEPELVRARQAEVREKALVTDIKPKTPAPESAPEPTPVEAKTDDSIGQKKRPESARRRQPKPQSKSLVNRVLGFLFGEPEATGIILPLKRRTIAVVLRRKEREMIAKSVQRVIQPTATKQPWTATTGNRAFS